MKPVLILLNIFILFAFSQTKFIDVGEPLPELDIKEAEQNLAELNDISDSKETTNYDNNLTNQTISDVVSETETSEDKSTDEPSSNVTETSLDSETSLSDADENKTLSADSTIKVLNTEPILAESTTNLLLNSNQEQTSLINNDSTTKLDESTTQVYDNTHTEISNENDFSTNGLETSTTQETPISETETSTEKIDLTETQTESSLITSESDSTASSNAITTETTKLNESTDHSEITSTTEEITTSINSYKDDIKQDTPTETASTTESTTTETSEETTLESSSESSTFDSTTSESATPIETTSIRDINEQTSKSYELIKPQPLENIMIEEKTEIKADCPELNCEFGYKTDLYGQTLCSCFNPCLEKKCGSNKICKIAKGEDGRFRGLCYDPAQIERPIKCHLPLKPGYCKDPSQRDYSSRFYFDSFHQTCKHFIYTGCDGNENNFNTWEKCQMECNTCTMPPVKGPCRASLIRYYYDQTNQTCVPFSFGGCRGNENNFSNRKLCEDSCVTRKTGALFLHGMPIEKIKTYYRNGGSKQKKTSNQVENFTKQNIINQ